MVSDKNEIYKKNSINRFIKVLNKNEREKEVNK